MLHVGINLLSVLPEITGGWSYLHELLGALAAHAGDRDVRFTAFVTPESEPVVPRSPRFHVVRLPLGARRRPVRVAAETLVLPLLAARHGVDVMHHAGAVLPMTERRPSVVTIYDLLVYRHPDLVPPLKRMYLRRMIARTLRRASVLAPISATTAHEMHTAMGVAPERMVVVPWVVPARFAPQPAAAVARFRAGHALPENFWPLVAEPFPHKNLERLLRALARLREGGGERWPLVLRSRPAPGLLALIASLGLEGEVILLPRLSDEEMPVLYSAASAFVFPSLFEGAGLPLGEAMACGCPVVASDIPTTHEFGGSAAMLFDPTDVSAIAAAMGRMMASPGERAARRDAGLLQTAGMRAGVVAARCIEAYRRAYANGHALELAPLGTPAGD